MVFSRKIVAKIGSSSPNFRGEHEKTSLKTKKLMSAPGKLGMFETT